MIDENDYKKLRKELKLTQLELSTAIGEKESRIWLLENGFMDHVDPAAVERIDKKLQDLCELQELEMMRT